MSREALGRESAAGCLNAVPMACTGAHLNAIRVALQQLLKQLLGLVKILQAYVQHGCELPAC